MSEGPVRGHRRGRGWTRVSYGLHRPAADEDDRADLRAWQLVLPPGGRFTHLTAAALHGWWALPVPTSLPVFVAVPKRGSRPRREGMHVLRRDRTGAGVVVDGLQVEEPLEVLLACAQHLALLDLVVLLDAALRAGSCRMPQMRAAARPRRRGAPLLRSALELADGRAESPWETLLRLLHVTCGIDVEPQYELKDETGSVLAVADLWVRGTNALHEYDGEHHLRRPQQRKDLARARRIGNRTWVRRGYTSAEVLHQSVGIVRDADLSMGREHRPERIREWHQLLAESTFTASGRQRLLRRLGVQVDAGRPRSA